MSLVSILNGHAQYLFSRFKDNFFNDKIITLCQRIIGCIFIVRKILYYLKQSWFLKQKVSSSTTLPSPIKQTITQNTVNNILQRGITPGRLSIFFILLKATPIQSQSKVHCTSEHTNNIFIDHKTFHSSKNLTNFP